MNRRTFQKILIGSAGFGLMNGPIGLLADPPVCQVARKYPTYLFRYTYRRSPAGVVSLWMRVINTKDTNSSVPFSLNVASDPQMQNIQRSMNFTSVPEKSFITRRRFKLGAAFGPGAPLFCTLQAAAGVWTSQVFMLQPNSSNQIST